MAIIFLHRLYILIHPLLPSVAITYFRILYESPFKSKSDSFIKELHKIKELLCEECTTSTTADLLITTRDYLQNG